MLDKYVLVYYPMYIVFYFYYGNETLRYSVILYGNTSNQSGFRLCEKRTVREPAVINGKGGWLHG